MTDGSSDPPIAAAAVLAAVGVTRRRVRAAEVIVAVDAVDLDVRPGELTVIAGPSGSGKTTLLTVLAGLEQPDEGRVVTAPPLPADTSPSALPWSDLAFVPQAPSLLDELPLEENVELAARLAPTGAPSAPDDATAALLEELGLAHLAGRYPSHVSGGEQQRATLARALRLRPTVLLADEPTAHQDRSRTDQVVLVLRDHAARGNAVVVASHSDEVLDAADRLVELEDGRVVADRTWPSGR